MGLFRKKKPEPTPVLRYVDWEKELGFLDVLVSRELNIIRNIFVDLHKNDESRFVDDDRIKSVVAVSVADIVESISPQYLEFLSTKYFNGTEAVVDYVTNTLYIATLNDVVEIYNQRSIAEVRKQQAVIANQQVKELNKKKE